MTLHGLFAVFAKPREAIWLVWPALPHSLRRAQKREPYRRSRVEHLILGGQEAWKTIPKKI